MKKVLLHNILAITDIEWPWQKLVTGMWLKIHPPIDEMKHELIKQLRNDKL